MSRMKYFHLYHIIQKDAETCKSQLLQSVRKMLHHYTNEKTLPFDVRNMKNTRRFISVYFCILRLLKRLEDDRTRRLRRLGITACIAQRGRNITGICRTVKYDVLFECRTGENAQ